jgi:hypothetical protein
MNESLSLRAILTQWAAGYPNSQTEGGRGELPLVGLNTDRVFELATESLERSSATVTSLVEGAAVNLAMFDARSERIERQNEDARLSLEALVKNA